MRRFNTHVRVGSAANGIVLPVTDLTVKPEPYTGSGSTVRTLFDGRRELRPPTWGFRVTLKWNELRGDTESLRAAMTLLVNTAHGEYPHDLYLTTENGGATFDPTHVLTDLIPELTGEELTAMWDKRARKKPATLTLVTASQAYTTIPAWLAE